MNHFHFFVQSKMSLFQQILRLHMTIMPNQQNIYFFNNNNNFKNLYLILLIHKIIILQIRNCNKIPVIYNNIRTTENTIPI